MKNTRINAAPTRRKHAEYSGCPACDQSFIVMGADNFCDWDICPDCPYRIVGVSEHSADERSDSVESTSASHSLGSEAV
jgi:hypothetical protein